MTLFPPFLLSAAFLWIILKDKPSRTYYEMEDQKEDQKPIDTVLPGKPDVSQAQDLPRPEFRRPLNLQGPQGQSSHRQTKNSQLDTPYQTQNQQQPQWESPDTDSEIFPDTKSTTTSVGASPDIEAFQVPDKKTRIAPEIASATAVVRPNSGNWI